MLFSVLAFQGGKLCLSTSESVPEKKPWEKYLYPHPKTERMVFYNKVIEDIHMSTSGHAKHESYLREQQSFRWNVQVQLENLSKKVEFYNNPASSIPAYRKIAKDNIKKCNKNVCNSLLCKVDNSVSDAEKLDGELKQRRERLLDSQNISGIKKGCEEEYGYLNQKLEQLQEISKKLLIVSNDLNVSCVLLSRSRVQIDATSKENARRKRRKKENRRKAEAEKQKRLEKRCTEILTMLVPDKSSQLCQLVIKKENIPLEKQIKHSHELKLDELKNLKPKFHLQALKYLKTLNIFCGDALVPVQLAIQKLMGNPSDAAEIVECTSSSSYDDESDDQSSSAANNDTSMQF